MADTYVLELLNISKSFPGVRALSEVSVRVRPGEVQALVGENGAGKSTLLKIMFGIQAPDSGKIIVSGNEVRLTSPSHAQQIGISLVHQELQQIPELNVAQNIFLAREITYPGQLFVNRGRSYEEAEAQLRRIGMEINVRQQVKTLSIANRQMVEIAKALLGNARVIAFDEPTSSLTDVETDKLFDVIRDLKAHGVGIIYVSHRLEEIMKIADRVTVLRDGKLVGEVPIQEVDQATIVRMMIERESLKERLDASLVETPQPSRAYKLAAVVKYLGNPYWRVLGRGMEEEAARHGLTFAIQGAASETDREGQLKALQSMLEAKPDAVLVSPQDDTNLAPAITQARQAGILVINVHDAFLADAEHFVGANQQESGTRAANYFIHKFPQGGKVAIIEGQPGVYAVRERTRGFKDSLPKTRFEIVASVSGDWDRQKSQNLAADLLAAHPDLLGFYCNNDNMALGVMEAVKAADCLGQVVVIGNDGTGEAYNSIRAKEITGTIDSFPEQTGQIAVRQAICLLEGMKSPAQIYTPQNLITLYNIDRPADVPYQESEPVTPVRHTATVERGTPGPSGQGAPARHAAGEEILRAVNLRTRKLRNCSLSLYKGELLGIAGLVSSGRTELVRAIYGADPAEGEIYVRGRKAHIRSPEDAIRYGIGFLPEDRKASGLERLLSTKINISLASLPRLSRFGIVVDYGAVTREGEQYVKALDIQPPHLDRLVLNLSGGNQQKVILARWLLANSEILIFDEPTRGIDVGAKVEIYRLMEKLLDQGKSIIMVSSELPEVLRMSQRVLVMREGQIVQEMPRSSATQETIMYYATGGKKAND
jgi:ribose transport system substrate-binding protein